MKYLAYGIGYNTGEKQFYNPDGHRTREGEYWYSMFVRSYSKQYQDKKPRYMGCSVDSSFHDFEDFRLWMKDQVGSDNQGWHIDKDILFANNKVYSPETCVFVPRELNSFYTKRQKSRGKYPLGVSYHKPLDKFMVSGHNLCGGTVYLGVVDNPSEGFEIFLDFKRKQAKELANKWEGKVDNRVVESLLSFTLSEDD